MKKIITVITLTVLTPLVAPLSSSADVFPVSILFSHMDLNKDGLISREEINKKSKLSKEFNKFDKNQDDKLDQQEFEIFIVTVNI